MNNFPRPHTYNANNINNINDIKDNNPIALRQNFYKEDTSPLPVIPKINYYPPEWDKKKLKLPPLSSILSNHYYVIACVVFTSIVVTMAMIAMIFNEVWMLFAK